MSDPERGFLDRRSDERSGFFWPLIVIPLYESMVGTDTLLPPPPPPPGPAVGVEGETGGSTGAHDGRGFPLGGIIQIWIIPEADVACPSVTTYESVSSPEKFVGMV